MSDVLLIESDSVARAKEALQRVQIVPHPFSTERVEKHVHTGQTLYEMMGAAGCKPGRSYLVFLNGEWVPPELWKRVRPKPHAEVIIRAVPMGGDSGGDSNKTLRTILQVVVIIVALYIVVASAGTVTPFVALGAAAIFSVVANLAIAALLPPKFATPKELGPDAPGFSISGARNQAAPGGPLPRIFGHHHLVLPRRPACATS